MIRNGRQLAVSTARSVLRTCNEFFISFTSEMINFKKNKKNISFAFNFWLLF